MTVSPAEKAQKTTSQQVARKSFVIDTNVLLHDPDALNKFKENDIVLPLTVLEELDNMKRLSNDLGRNSRAVIRYLDGVKFKAKGDWKSGIHLENGTRIWVFTDGRHAEDFTLPENVNSHKIIRAAYALKKKGDMPVVFVSKDLGSRIKAEAVGLEAEDYENLKAPFDTIYRGMVQVETEKRDIDLFYRDGKLPIPDVECRNNEYLVLHSPENSSAVGKVNKKDGILEALLPAKDLWGITPRNLEQQVAVDLLLRDDVKLVTLVGQAGTGKTVLALAAALHKVFDEGVYGRILVSRPVIPLGRDIGFLPGTKEEKLQSWMQPIFDNLAFLCDSSEKEPNETLRWVMESNKLEMEAVTYIRGRSLPKMFIIIDEAQNLTPHEVKTIVSRAGQGTKVIMAGDPYQIDNPYLDRDSNGLTVAIDKFQNHSLFGHVYLNTTERSDLAAAAAEIL